jgi:thiosulfate dehydrogenase
MTGASNARRVAEALIAVSLSACGATTQASETERGKELFHSTELSPSSRNAYTCSTCHDELEVGEGLKPGALLAGVTHRSQFWGGQQNDLLRAVNDCRRYFMAANTPLKPDEPDAVALYSYLEALGDAQESEPTEFTVVRTVSDVARGDTNAGAGLFQRACESCHGVANEGVGRLVFDAPILPQDTLAEHATFSARAQRLVFIEKIRHGGFLGYGGTMPPYSTEVLSDQDIADILESLGVLGPQ